jgi:hypothetical protein
LTPRFSVQALAEKIGELSMAMAVRRDIAVASLTEAAAETTADMSAYFTQNAQQLVVRTALASVVIASNGIAFFAGEHTSHAETRQSTYQIVDGPWYFHDPKSPPRIASPTIGLAQTGDTLTLSCHVTGDNVNGDAEWDLATDQNNGLIGFVADYGTSTPVHRGQEAAELTALGIPECGSSTVAQQEAPNLNYDRTAAVDWANTHARDPQTNGEECTKFVSEALWAGGLPQDSIWNNQGRYPSGKPFPTIFDGSKTANAAPLLVNYLESHYSTQWIHIDTNGNDVSQAEEGDIIAYSWSGTNADGTPASIDHLAFVVGSDESDAQYPMVAEWGQFDHYGPAQYAHNPASPYTSRKWNWSALATKIPTNECVSSAF